ncbi:hypothetical protein T492DRAFT_551482 [Pavlovales sp. CCMP2436]|nr:hypothetical protein T492DRAFT_551482 [Pavlovales sp. CCMP2436]
MEMRPLATFFEALLATALLVSGDSVGEIREAEEGCGPTELLEVELRGVHSGKAVWLHELAGLRALSAQQLSARPEFICSEVVEGVNAELGTTFEVRTASRQPDVSSDAADEAGGSTIQLPKAGGGGGEGDGAEVAIALHVLHFLLAKFATRTGEQQGLRKGCAA